MERLKIKALSGSAGEIAADKLAVNGKVAGLLIQPNPGYRSFAAANGVNISWFSWFT